MAQWRKMNTKLLALIGVTIVVALTGFFVLRKNDASPIHYQPTRLATYDELQEAVAKMKRGEAYRVGGNYITRLERSGVKFDPARLNDNSYQYCVIVSRVSLDFIITITPEQIETMRMERGLQVSSLSKDQLRLLQRMAWYSGRTGSDTGHLSGMLWISNLSRGRGVQTSWKWTRPDGLPDNLRFGLEDVSVDIRKNMAAEPTKARDVVGDICRGIPWIRNP